MPPRSPLVPGPGPRPDSKAKLAPTEGLEWGISREGYDYRWFRIYDDDPAWCRAACENDSSCAAFTYAHAGFRDTYAVCQLKSAVPQPHYDNCCVSGVTSRR